MSEELLISGTSFLINKDGTLLTNAHVVGSRKEMKVALRGQEFTATLIATDLVNDLAILSTDLRDKKFLRFSRKDVEREDDISALGFGFGKRYSSDVKATKGIVSALSGVANNYSHFQTDAAIQVGNSGGPVINNSSSVVGIAVAKLNTEIAYKDSGTIAENVNFAIKVSTVKQFLDANNITYELEDDIKINSKLRNDIIDDSVLYIFSNETDINQEINVPYSYSSPVAGVLEVSPNIEKNAALKYHLKGKKINFDREIKPNIDSITELYSDGEMISTNTMWLRVWGDDLKYHDLNSPKDGFHFQIIKILRDINQRVEKGDHIMILEPIKVSEKINKSKLVAPGKWDSSDEGYSLNCNSCYRSVLYRAVEEDTLTKILKEESKYLECPLCFNYGLIFVLGPKQRKIRNEEARIRINNRKEAQNSQGWLGYWWIICILGVIIYSIAAN